MGLSFNREFLRAYYVLAALCILQSRLPCAGDRRPQFQMEKWLSEVWLAMLSRRVRDQAGAGTPGPLHCDRPAIGTGGAKILQLHS